MQNVGYFAVAQLAGWMAAGVPFVSRLKVGTAAVTADGQRWELGLLLARQRQATVDLPVAIGADQRLICRLIAVRVPVWEERPFAPTRTAPFVQLLATAGSPLPQFAGRLSIGGGVGDRRLVNNTA